MKKATVTYTAPAGENKMLEIGGTVLVSGKSDTVICDDALMDKMVKAGGALKVENVSDYEAPPKEAPKEVPKEAHDDDHKKHR